MQFMADDGTVFKTQEECESYENELNSKKDEQKKRWQEVEEAYKKAEALVDKYLEDFHSEDLEKNPLAKCLNDMLGVLKNI